MGRYAMIYSGFWSGVTGRQLRQDGESRTLAVYLMSSPHANMIGLYACPVAYICHDLGYPAEAVQRSMRVLERLGFAEYDEVTEMVWVKRFAHYQLGQLNSKDKRTIWARRVYGELPQSKLLGPFFDEYSKALHLEHRRGWADPYANLEMGGSGSENREQDQDQKQKQIQEQGPEKGVNMGLQVFTPVPEFSNDIQPVIDTWNEEMTHRAAEKNGAPHKPKRFGPLSKEWEEVRRRLSEGYSVEELQNAVRGMFKNEFNNGKNATGRQYLSLLVAMRSSNVSDFANQTQGKPLLDDEFMEFMRK